MRAELAGSIEILPVDDEVATETCGLLEEHDDKTWSHIDATSFALMGREAATTVFSLDRHFERPGLHVVPGPASHSVTRIARP